MLDEHALLPARMAMPPIEPNFELPPRPRLALPMPGSPPPHLSYPASKPTAAPSRPHQLVGLPAFFGSPDPHNVDGDVWARPTTTHVSALWTPDQPSIDWAPTPPARRRSVSDPETSTLRQHCSDEQDLDAGAVWPLVPWSVTNALFADGDEDIFDRGRLPFRLGPSLSSTSMVPSGSLAQHELGYRTPRRTFSPCRRADDDDHFASDDAAPMDSRLSASTPADEAIECVAGRALRADAGRWLGVFRWSNDPVSYATAPPETSSEVQYGQQLR